MLKATIHDLALFENFLGIINKFVQQCQFDLGTDKVNVYCKNTVSYSSARLLLDSNVITLNEGQNVDRVKICIRDVIAFKSAISIVQQLQDVKGIEVGLETVVSDDDEVFVKNIKYKSKTGGSFNIITIDFDVIKDLVSKDMTINLNEDWSFNINPKNLDIAQNKTNNIVNLDEVSVYIFPKSENGPAIIDLSSKKSASMNSIAIPISDSSVGSLSGFSFDEIAIHESSFRIFNILKVTNSDDIKCSFNFENNVFYIKSKLNVDEYSINSRLFVQMVKGK